MARLSKVHLGSCLVMPRVTGVKKYNPAYVFARSSGVARINTDACLACGLCRNERCPMDAVYKVDGAYQVNEPRCIGCGVCIVTCPAEAISLGSRPTTELALIANNIRDWSRQRISAITQRPNAGA